MDDMPAPGRTEAPTGHSTASDDDDAAAGPPGAGVAEPEMATDSRVLGAVALLEGLDRLDVGEHVGVYEQVHVHLRDALTDTAGRDAPAPE